MKQKNYVFGLYDGDKLLDTTNLDEDDPEYARELFLDEFGWGDKYLHRKNLIELKVDLIEVNED
ncbi:hypothetical protein ACFLQL_00560 [Verrucomicrobiota bacterium]